MDCKNGELILKKCNDPSYNQVDDQCNNAKKEMADALLMYAVKCVAFQDQEGSTECNLLKNQLKTNRNTEKEVCANVKIWNSRDKEYKYIPY